jgi:hypothetical protein
MDLGDGTVERFGDRLRWGESVAQGDLEIQPPDFKVMLDDKGPRH